MHTAMPTHSAAKCIVFQVRFSAGTGARSSFVRLDMSGGWCRRCRCGSSRRRQNDRRLFLLDRISGALPGVESAFEREDVLVTQLAELLRHTGARVLARSRAERGDHPSAWDLSEMLLLGVDRHSHGSRNALGGLGVRIMGARVDDGDRLTPIEAPLQLVCGDTRNGVLHVIFYGLGAAVIEIDRKSTRLNSSHLVISYAVFCLKKKIT